VKNKELQKVIFLLWKGWKIEGCPENSENLKRAIFNCIFRKNRRKFSRVPASPKGKIKTLKNNLKLFRIFFYFQKNSKQEKVVNKIKEKCFSCFSFSHKTMTLWR
jgi:hypothetical protein